MPRSEKAHLNYSPLVVQTCSQSSLRKKYVCDICQRGLSTGSHLTRHVKIHSGEKNHKCSFPGCKTRCNRSDNLLQHYKTHFCTKSLDSHKTHFYRRSRRTRTKEDAPHCCMEPFSAASPETYPILPAVSPLAVSLANSDSELNYDFRFLSGHSEDGRHNAVGGSNWALSAAMSGHFSISNSHNPQYHPLFPTSVSSVQSGLSTPAYHPYNAYAPNGHVWQPRQYWPSTGCHLQHHLQVIPPFEALRQGIGAAVT